MHAERLGKYELVQHLASGGMASVYLARISGPGGFERHVVLKTLRTEGLVDQTLIPMFLDEARVVATLHHQHISQVYEVGNIDGTYFLAMEYVHGETVRAVLEAAIDQGRRLPLAFGVTVVCAAAAGLHHAHERRGSGGASLGIVHRDVTPSNVIVSYDGSIKLIDFGIAKAVGRATHTRTGFIKGKVGYMAPEQVRGHAVDRRSDVFALGVLAYELTTQRRAFSGESQFETLERTVHSDLIAPTQIVPGYPVELEDVILTALELDPDDRYPDADAMRRALEQIAIMLHLPTGEATVVAVLDELYGFRPEPWLLAAAPPEAEAITPIRAATPIVALPPLARDRSFARGSAEHDSIDDSAPTDPQPLDTDEVITDRIEPVEPRTMPPRSVPPRTMPMPVPVRVPAQISAPSSRASREPEPETPVPAVDFEIELESTPAPAAAPAPAAVPAAAAAVAVPAAARAVAAAAAPVAVAAPAPRVRSEMRTATILVTLAAAFAIGIVVAMALTGDNELATAPTDAAPPAPAPVAAPPPDAAIAQPVPAPAAPLPTRTVVALNVVTDPPGATVVLDGVRLGTAPYASTVPFRAGRAVLKVRKSDRLPVRIEVSLDHDVTWSVRLPPRPR